MVWGFKKVVARVLGGLDGRGLCLDGVASIHGCQRKSGKDGRHRALRARRCRARATRVHTVGRKGE